MKNILKSFKRFDNPAHAGVVQAEGLAYVFEAVAAAGCAHAIELAHAAWWECCNTRPAPFCSF